MCKIKLLMKHNQGIYSLFNMVNLVDKATVGRLVEVLIKGSAQDIRQAKLEKAFRQLIKERGVAESAKALRKRYTVIRDIVVAMGILVVRGRRPDKDIQERNKKIRLLRKKKFYLHNIGEQHGIGRERVRQILQETGGDPLAEATDR